MLGGLPLRYVAAVGGLLLIAASVAAGFAVWYWLPATIVVTGFLLGGALPIGLHAFTGAFMFDPTKTSDGLTASNSPSVGSRLMMSLLPILIFTMAFSLLLGSWSLPSVRAAVVSIAGDSRPFVAERGVRDTDRGVALLACEVLTRKHGDRSADVLLSQLMEADDALTECIMSGLRHPATNSRYLLGLRSYQWFEALMSEDLAPARACQHANWLRQADALGETQAAMELFVCAVNGKTHAGRSCCADSIRAATQGAGVATLLPPPQVVGDSRWLPAVPALIDIIANGHDPEIDQNLRGSSGDKLRAWSVQTACVAFERLGRSDRHQVARDLRGVWTKRQQCTLPPMNEKNFQIWNAACSELFTDVYEPAPELADQLCGRIRLSLKNDALQEGRLFVRRALRRASAPEGEKKLMKSLLDYSILKRADRSPSKHRKRARVVDPNFDDETFVQSLREAMQPDNTAEDLDETIKMIRQMTQ